MIDKRIKFDDCYQSDGITSLYFVAPKEMLKTFIPNNDYPEAVSMEISLEFPMQENLESKYASICVSPTRQYEDTTEEYDWYDVDLPYDEVEELIALALKNMEES